MKQLLLLIVLASIMSNTFSQLNKNQFLVGGSISFNASKYGDPNIYGSKYSQLEISPSAGYFIFDKLTTGAEISYSYYKSQLHYGGDIINYIDNSLILSPFIRYYVLPKSYKINLFGHLSYDYLRTKSKSATGSESYSSSTSTQNGFNFKAGPVLFINPCIALELSLSYSTRKPKDDLRTNGFMTGIGFQIHLGNKKS